MSNHDNLDRMFDNDNDNDGPREGRYDRRSSRPRRGGPGGGPGGGRARRGRRKVDYFQSSDTVPNYKEVDILQRFMTDRAKIRPRRQTGLSAKNQRKLAREIKRARHLALLPYTDEQTRR